jgi:DNA repair exonuclease SbcCD ATPase subunit
MRIVSLNPTGLGPYQLAPTIVLEDGLYHLEGKNGAGKTWIFNTITLVLYGRVESFAEGVVGNANDDVIHEGYHGCCPRVEFTDDKGTLWRVTYSRKWKGESPYANDSPLWPYAGTCIYLERYQSGDWVDERSAEMPNTRKRILEIVGISYDRFITATYLPQGRGFNFLRGTNALRVQILSDVVGLSVWDAAVDKVRAILDPLSQQLAALGTKESFLRGQLSTIHLYSDAELATHRSDLLAADDMIASLKLTEDHWNAEWHSAVGQLKAIEAGNSPQVAARNELQAKWGAVIAEARGRAHAAKESLVKALGEHTIRGRAVYPEETKLYAEIEALQSALKNPALCPLCGQSVTTEFIASQIEALRSALAEKEVEQRQAIAAQMHDLINLQAEIDRLTEAHCTAEGDLTEAQVALETALETVVIHTDPGETRAYVLECQAKAAEARAARDQLVLSAATLKGQLQKAEQDRNQAQSIRVQLEEIRVSADALEREAKEWAWIKNNLGERGCKAWQIEAAVLRLNQILNDVLAALDPNLKVALTTKKANLKGVISQDIGISVSDSTKKNVPIYLYSGGETSLIAFAILVSLWYLADEYATGCGLLLLDEVVSALDTTNATVATMFLETLRATGRTVFVISHAQCVDQLNFDHRITVTKHEGVSSIEVQ